MHTHLWKDGSVAFYRHFDVSTNRHISFHSYRVEDWPSPACGVLTEEVDFTIYLLQVRWRQELGGLLLLLLI